METQVLSIVWRIRRVLALAILVVFQVSQTQAQEPYNYKDKKFKFTVNLPKEPEDVNDKPIHQVLCTQSASKTFHIMVFNAKVKINKATVVKTPMDQLNDYKLGKSYTIAGSTEFSSNGIDVVDFWGTISGLNILSRMFVYEENVYQLMIYSTTDDITREISYPFFNSMKLANGTQIQSADYDASAYRNFDFSKKASAVGTVGIPSSGGAVDRSAVKVALVIGIKSYQSVPPLANTLNDAQDMAAVLKTKGFSVIEVYDPKTKAEIRSGIIEFNKSMQGNSNGVGLVYYSGHGMQLDGANYIIPASATLEIKADVEEQCLNMDYVLRAMEGNGNQLNIIILDACRNNPFRSFSRSAEKGLSMVDAPKGSYIVYATKPGSVASDGTGRNGLFTSKLLKFINTPDITLEEVFKNVAAEVARDSGDAQRPWISSDFTGVFYFNPKK